MIVYHSGRGTDTRERAGNPEDIVSVPVAVMASFTWMTPDQRRRMKKLKKQREADPPEVGCVKSHFLDSGSFSLWTKAAKFSQETGRPEAEFYDSEEHWQYLKDYAAFVKKYQIGIDLFANVDAIPSKSKGVLALSPTQSAELTWRNQRYLEKEFGITPVPVVHYREDLKWLRKYIDKGYELIALGGLVGSTDQDGCRDWIDRAFEMVCDNPQRLPCVKLHGFGVTSYDLMVSLPWWSVDSTTWTLSGGFGKILVPHRRSGKFVFTEQPYDVQISSESPKTSEAGRHYLTMSTAEQAVVRDWLQHINVPLGKVDAEGKAVENGVITRHTERRAANLLFFEKMQEALPTWPWAWKSTRRKGFGMVR